MIGIIGAMDVEVRGIVTNIAEPAKNTVGNIEFTSGTLYGKEVVCDSVPSRGTAYTGRPEDAFKFRVPRLWLCR